nr:hypothetical protein Iba_chr10cCG0030 [Ipomoea batatas]
MSEKSQTGSSSTLSPPWGGDGDEVSCELLFLSASAFCCDVDAEASLAAAAICCGGGGCRASSSPPSAAGGAAGATHAGRLSNALAHLGFFNKFAVLREDTNVGESPSTHGKGKSTFVFGESSRAKTTLNKNSPPNRHPPPPAEGVPPLDNVRHIARAQMINRSGAQESPRCRGMSSKRGGRASSRENPNAAKGSGHVGLTSVFQFVSTVPAAAGGGGSNQFGQVLPEETGVDLVPHPFYLANTHNINITPKRPDTTAFAVGILEVCLAEKMELLERRGFSSNLNCCRMLKPRQGLCVFEGGRSGGVMRGGSARTKKGKKKKVVLTFQAVLASKLFSLPTVSFQVVLSPPSCRLYDELLCSH